MSLEMNDAVAAIIKDPDGRLLLQLRDDYSHIWYPGHWGLFGGGVDVGESPDSALQREIFEELNLEITKFNEFVTFDFDLTCVGKRNYFRKYYLVDISLSDSEQIVLGEGREAKFFQISDLSDLTITPYDSFAMTLYKDHFWGQ